MTVPISLLLALASAPAQEEGEAYDPSLLEPRVYGLRFELPAAEWRRVAVESVSSRLVYEPREGAAYVRLRLSRVPGRRRPEVDADWEGARIETADSFREAFAGGVEVAGAERVQAAGQPALEVLLKLKEADGTARRAVATVFFHGGDAWRLELIAADDAFERHLGAYRSIRGGIAVESAGMLLWILVGAAVTAAAAWLAFGRRREPE
jgi:hypothetical protein